MKLLLRQATILHSSSPFHLKKADLLIVDGKIVKIAHRIDDSEATEIVSADLHVSVGWMDMGVVATDPGLEHKESIETLQKVAAAGGFTDIAVLPNTEPVTQNKAAVNYFKQFSGNSAVTIHPMAAVTVDCKGKDFTEMMDLHQAGAVAFTDGLHPLWNADILLKTLQYLSPLNALLINRPEEPTLAFMGQMHEGVMSTQLGMKGIPDTAEDLMIARDLQLLEYADIQSKIPILHFSKVSTIAGIKRIREAKAKGLAVSCDVSVNQLIFTDQDVQTFDSNYKVTPPYRDKKTIKFIQKALDDGTIDAITSDHHPHDEEAKKLTFDDADFGIIGLQTTFANALKFSGLSLETLIAKMTVLPRNLLRMNFPDLAENNPAVLTIFDPTAEWDYTEKTNVSTAKNSPFFGTTFKGKVMGIVKGTQATFTS